MTPRAREAVRMAADEYDRLASGCEVEADLCRQIATLLRDERVVDAVDACDRLRRLRGEGRSTTLADQLLRSLEERDPDLWRELEISVQIKLIREAPIDVVKVMAAVHGATCRDGVGCRVMAAIAERLRG